MNFETLFSLAGIVAMLGWLALLLSPLAPRLSDRFAGLIVPLALSLGYVALAGVPAAESGVPSAGVTNRDSSDVRSAGLPNRRSLSVAGLWQ